MATEAVPAEAGRERRSRNDSSGFKPLTPSVSTNRPCFSGTIGPNQQLTDPPGCPLRPRRRPAPGAAPPAAAAPPRRRPPRRPLPPPRRRPPRRPLPPPRPAPLLPPPRPAPLLPPPCSLPPAAAPPPPRRRPAAAPPRAPRHPPPPCSRRTAAAPPPPAPGRPTAQIFPLDINRNLQYINYILRYEAR